MSLNNPKSVIGYIVFANTETSYGQGAAIGAGNAIQCQGENPQFDIKYQSDGKRVAANYSAGNVRGTTPSGRTVDGVIKIELKGLGSAYSTSSRAPNSDPFLLASNLSASFQGNKVVYAPLPLGSVPTSIGLQVYGNGELINISGSFCDFSITTGGPGISIAEFKLSGLPSDVVDVSNPTGSLPARTWTAQNIIPPKAELIGLTIGTYTTANVRSITYTHGQTMTPRTSLSATGSMAGFVLGRRNPELKMTIEAEQLGTFDAYMTQKLATTNAINYTVGTLGTNNSWTMAFPSCSLMGVQRKGDGPIAVWDLTFAPAVSAPDANDDMSLTFNA